MIVMMKVTKTVKVKSQQCTHNSPTLVQSRDPPSMPSSCVGMPSITTQYALNIKRRKSLKSVTHRAYGRMPCVYLYMVGSLGSAVSPQYAYYAAGLSSL